MITRKKIGIMVLVLVLLIAALLATQFAQAATLPNSLYVPHTTVQVRSAPSVTAPALQTLYAAAPPYASTEYPVLDWTFSPGDQWVYIEYAAGQYGFAPVQIGYTVYGSVKFNLGVIYGQAPAP